MFCTKCGKQIKDGSLFCAHCGAPQSQNSGAGGNGQGPVPKPEPKSGNSKLPLIIVGVVLAVLLLIAAIVMVPKLFKKDDTTSSDKPGRVTEWMQKDADESENDPEPESEDRGGDIELLSEDTLEGQLQRQIIEMNSEDYELQAVDVYADNHQVNTRDTGLTWSDDVFYTMEGYKTHASYYNKNQCTLVKKELLNAQTGNIMNYEVYLNPVSGVANKIVGIEYLAEGIEVTEYYYTESGKANFIFQYTADNYISSYATPDKEGQRFLFGNDCLITWRQVGADVTWNYCVGDNEASRLNQSWSSSTIRTYAQLDESTRAAYDAIEKKMLDAAYNTYETVMNAEGITRIQGYIYDQNSNPLPNATVELYASDFVSYIFTVRTDSNGVYNIYVPFETYSYNVKVHMEGYHSCDIHQVEVNNEQIGAYQDSVYLFSDTASDTNVYLTLGDAFNYNYSGDGMMRLPYANVYVREGLNNRYGDVIYQGTTDQNGYIVLVLKPSVYTVEVSADGYETMYYTIIANPILENNYEFYAAPTLNDDEYAVVLTWGSMPYDLDSHLFTTRGTTSDHIWYGDTYDDYDNYLDVDDTTSYGPETVTIRSFRTTDYYKYCVVDFTNCAEGNYNSMDMSYSGATVNVYSSDGLIGVFHVPTNTPAVIWEVFEIRNGQLTPIQRCYNNVTNKDWWHNDK